MMPSIRHWFLIMGLLCQQAFGQGEANVWYFGYKAGVDFSSGKPQAIANSKMTADEGCASISTAKGRLLFYTDGITIWDSTHNIMPNGSALKGDFSSSQSGIIVPWPDSSHLFVVFSVDDFGGVDGVNYSVVNMRLNNNKGAVMAGKKNVSLIPRTCEKITAVRHSNGRDCWIITHKFGSDSVCAFLLSSTGINSNPVVTRTGYPISSSSNAYSIGYLKTSVDGTKIAFANFQLNQNILARFNNSTGKLSNIWSFYTAGAYGVEFSPLGKFLYVSTMIGRAVWQFNANAANQGDFQASGKIVGSGFSKYLGALQLGPDEKIYLSVMETPSLSVIHAPDSAGTACRLQKNAVPLSAGAECRFGLPTFNQTFLEHRTFDVFHTCLHDSTEFVLSSFLNMDSVLWTFGDPKSGVNNQSKLKQGVKHVFSDTGAYTVRMVVFYKQLKDTSERVVRIKKIQHFIGNDTAICAGNMAELGPKTDYASYLWNTGSLARHLQTSQPGKYWQNVVDADGCKSTDTAVVSNVVLKVNFSANDTAACLGDGPFVFQSQTEITGDALKKLNWNFGDGSTGILALMSKKYNAPGVFSVKLVAESNAKCKDSITRTVVVFPKPNAGFTVNENDQCQENQHFIFTNTSSIVSGNIVANQWYFGDGDSAVQQSVNGKKFSDSGNWSVQLITTSDAGCRDTANAEVYTVWTPEILFQAQHVCFPAPVKFNSAAQGVSLNQLKLNWDFGDGTTSAEWHPIKSYKKPGNYVVNLVAENVAGCRDTYTLDAVHVNPKPKAEFSYSASRLAEPGALEIQFTNTSSAEATYYFWDLGNGNFSQEKNPASIYHDSATYTFTLFVASDSGCLDTFSMIKYSEPAVFLPDAFTPDNNGFNDVYFASTNSTFRYWNMHIYNVWGQLVFVSNNPKQGWDGKFNGTTVAGGVYVCHLVFRNMEGPEKQLRTTITVLR